MIAEILSTNVQNIVILALTPIILAIIPYVFKSRRDNKKAADTVVSAAETVHSTGQDQLIVLQAMESAFIHIGELSGDLKDMREEMKKLTTSFTEHIKNDEAFMRKVFGFMAKAEPTISQIKEVVVDSNTMNHIAADERAVIATNLARQQPDSLDS